jgi:hypothetical protein
MLGQMSNAGFWVEKLTDKMLLPEDSANERRNLSKY